MIELITDKKRWNIVLNDIEYYDFYHTWDYHMLSKTEEEVPILVHYNINGKSIAIPLFIRKIHNSDFYDATSAYGYPGPITNFKCGDLDLGVFVQVLQKLLFESRIISVFSRLNPFIPCQEEFCKPLGEISTLGKIVFIDLTLSSEEQWGNYHKRLRTYINKARRTYTIKRLETSDEINTFVQLYYENMKRVNADKKYFFSEAYFYDLFRSKDFDTHTLLAVDKASNTIAGGAIFIKKNNLIQYHLSGVKNEFLSLNPIKLLIDEMRILGTFHKYQYLNLGGGVGNKEDSLFHFKSGFSSKCKDFKVWKYIVNESIYMDLVNKKLDSSLLDPTVNYFPLYRYPDQKN